MDVLIKAFLTWGITQLGMLIPWLGGFLAGPLGFIVEPLIGYATGLLYDWVSRLARYSAIDKQVGEDLSAAKSAQAALTVVQNNPQATEAEHAAALAEFTNRVRTLGKFRLQ